jgi:predicted amidohydrolase
VKALLAQLAPDDGRVELNLARVERTLSAHPHVELAVFPELFLCGYELAGVAELALDAQGPELGRVRAAAERARTAVMAGFAERLPDGTIANSAALIEADGELVAVHRKSHLFGDGERERFVEGAELLVVDLAGRRIGPLICFDMEFPEPARALVRTGADLLVTIAANMRPYGAEHELAARARALENRCPHLYVNRVGAHRALQFVGGSMAVDFCGRGTPALAHDEQLLEVEVPAAWADVGSDIDYLEHARRELPVRAVRSGCTRQRPAIGLAGSDRGHGRAA